MWLHLAWADRVYGRKIVFLERVFTMKRLSIIVCTILAASCVSVVQRQMNEIDYNLNDAPERALAEIQGIKESQLTRRKDLAYYALLKSAALDKNYIDVTSDSLINIAVDYYSGRSCSSKRMRSLYYQGLIRANAQRYSSAISSFEAAKNDALDIGDLRFLGLINRNLANIFNSTSNYPEALKYTRLAIDAFNRNGDSLYTDYARYSLAVVYLNEGHHIDSCRLLLNSILNREDLKPLHAEANLRYARTCVILKDSLQRAVELFRESPRYLFHIQDYSYCALAHAYLRQRDSSISWIREGYNADTTQLGRASLDALLYQIDSLDGNYLSALQKIRHAMIQQDLRTRNILKQSLSIAQKEYYKQESEIREERLQRQHTIIVGGIIVFILLLSLALLIMKRRMEAVESIQKEQMARLAVDNIYTQREKGQLVGTLFIERLSKLAGLSTLYYTAVTKEEKEALFGQFKRTAKELKESKSLFDTLESELNQHCSGIMDKLRAEIPQIKGQNRKIIALFFAGIPDVYIQAIMNRVSSGSLKTIRSRFRTTIKKSDAKDKDLFLNMLKYQ